MTIHGVSLISIVQHTPVWVFLLFAALVVMGVLALRTRTVKLWRVLLVPAVFISWGLESLAQRSIDQPVLALYWLGAGIVGLAIGWGTLRFDGLAVDRAGGCVSVPGSAVTLVRNIVVFLAKYGIAVAVALSPENGAVLAAWDVGISGLVAGYFAFWVIGLAGRWRAAAQPIAAH